MTKFIKGSVGKKTGPQSHIISNLGNINHYMWTVGGNTPFTWIAYTLHAHTQEVDSTPPTLEVQGVTTKIDIII